jgi:hypothetical protein
MSNYLAEGFKTDIINYLTGHPDYKYSVEEVKKLATDISKDIFSPIINELFKNDLLKKVIGVTV